MKRPAIALLTALLTACFGSYPEPDPGLSTAEMAKLVRPDVEDRQGWAEDVREALVAAGQIPDRERTCEVLAIVEQESGYQVDPGVPNLAEIAEGQIDERFAKLGFLAPAAKATLLDQRPEGADETFEERLETLKTERELDLLYRDILSYQEAQAPQVARAVHLAFPDLAEELNPVETAGSMQVSVRFARELGEDDGLSAYAVRDSLYTRHGGVHYGVARLYAHDAEYDRPLYLFADYNAGPYASRNAAFQTQLAELTGLQVDPDGDLLQWKENGKPKREQNGQTVTALLAWRAEQAPDLAEARLRSDLEREKEKRFEDTETWQRLKETYEAKMGKKPRYAQVPDLLLDSPKLQKDLTTRWFAERVDGRYRKCLARK